MGGRRREESRREAGESSVNIDGLRTLLPNIELLFNTVPARILGEALLQLVNTDALVIDLSSAPCGVDLETAERLGLKAWREGSIPARYAPRLAAQILYDFVEECL